MSIVTDVADMTDMTDMTIRPGRSTDLRELLNIWLRSVRATHTFLTERDIESLLPIVRDQALPNLNLWVLCANDDPVGFMGVGEGSIEALFIDPSHLRRGGGTLLIQHALQLMKPPLCVDVNEQNEGAIKFYQANGFEVIGRSPVDDGGRPFPLVHMIQVRSKMTTRRAGKRDAILAS